jgi:hypothetical protein
MTRLSAVALMGGAAFVAVDRCNAQEPKLRATLTHGDAVLAVAFRPDGKTLASSSSDQTIKLWDVATGKEQATLKGNTAGACPCCSARMATSARPILLQEAERIATEIANTLAEK